MTFNTPGSTFCNTGPAHHFNFNRQFGCIDAYASVPPSDNSHTRSGRPILVSRLPTRRAPRLDTSLQQHHPFRRRPLLVQGPRSSLVARQDLRSHHNGRSLRRPLLCRPRTSQAQAFFFSAHYGYWSGARLWCLHTRQGRTRQRGNLRNIDECRGVGFADPAAFN